MNKSEKQSRNTRNVFGILLLIILIGLSAFGKYASTNREYVSQLEAKMDSVQQSNQTLSSELHAANAKADSAQALAIAAVTIVTEATQVAQQKDADLDRALAAGAEAIAAAQQVANEYVALKKAQKRFVNMKKLMGDAITFLEHESRISEDAAGALRQSLANI